MMAREFPRACYTLRADPISVRYWCRPARDAAAHAGLQGLACVRRRFSYRRLHILPKRERIIMNHNRLRRLYREERTQANARDAVPMVLPQGTTQGEPGPPIGCVTIQV